LASRGTESSKFGELSRATATAIHELSHAFTMQYYKVPGGATWKSWEWWDEGTAVFMETHVSPENQDALRYAMLWADHPDIPLDDPSQLYQTGMFIRYLYYHSDLNKAEFITNVWQEASTDSTPFTALENALASGTSGLKFSSATHEDLFASGYCVDSYFCYDATKQWFAPLVYAYFGERQVTEAFDTYPVGPSGIRDTLDHLACRYYRFKPVANKSRLEIRLSDTKGDAPSLHLKAILCAVTHEMGKGDSVILASENSSQTYVGKLSDFTPEQVDHAILIVANCTYGDNEENDLSYAIAADAL
jgi:hypothetical protein